MTNRINLFRGLIKPHEMNYLKIGGIGTLLLCMSPHFVMADTGNDAAVTITQQKGNTVTGVITDDTGEPLIGVKIYSNYFYSWWWYSFVCYRWSSSRSTGFQ